MNASMALALAVGQDIPWKPTWAEALKEAKSSRKLAVLVFWQEKRPDCVRFQKETLSSAAVISTLKGCACARVDPEGTDAENYVWQQHGQPMPPMTFVYDPDGALLTTIRTLNPRNYPEALAATGTVYFREIEPLSKSLAEKPDQPDKGADLGAAYAKIENAYQSARWYATSVDLLAGRGEKAGAMRVLTAQLDRYYELKWYPQARGCCAKISELDPSDASKLGARAAWILGMADCAEKKWNDAITGLKAACERFPKAEILDKMMFTLASAHMYARDKEGAIAVFEAIVAKFPNTETARLAELQASKLRSK